MKKLLLFALLFAGCSSMRITSNKDTSRVDFVKIKSGKISVYSSDLFITLSDKEKVSGSKTKSDILNEIKFCFNNLIPTALIKIDSIPLPSDYNGDFSIDFKKQLNSFFDKQTADYVFILSKSMDHDMELRQSPNGLPGKFNVVDNKVSNVLVELWSVKEREIVLDYTIEQKGHIDLSKSILKAVEYISYEGKGNLN